MCGICGIAARDLSPLELRSRTEQANELLRHRGPDGRGVWVDESGLALGHVRLSILDLREAAGQPMVSRSGRWVLTYNGEIYNFRALRLELEARGVVFRTTSDTEVLLEAISLWGVEAGLPKFFGMFAFAAWDRENRKLFLARDRLGQKPLFYGASKSRFVFGSEVRVLKAYEPETRVCREACALMLRYKAVPAPFTIYEGYLKLPPGHWLEYDLESGKLGKPTAYWSPRPSSVVPSMEQLRDAFERAVEERRVSDVPLGAFLSGGIDSSLVVAAMQKAGSKPVKTFTIGFQQAEFNEAGHAEEVARYLGTDHTELRVSQDDLLAVVPELARIYDEPFGDSSQIPTVLVSRLARQQVTVVLSGDGGDEGFAGYNRHLWLPRILRGLQLCPEVVKLLLERVLGSRLADTVLPWLSEKNLLPVRMVRDKLDKLRALLRCSDYPGIYRQALSFTEVPGSLVAGLAKGAIQESRWEQISDPILAGCIADLEFYLHNIVLTKVDRASMSCGLEARSPFLDFRLVEMGLAAPTAWKIGRGGGKLLLRDWLREAVPQRLFERPKMGFAVPLAQWLRGELKGWGEDLLSGSILQSGDILQPLAVEKLWREHQSGARRHHHLLWNVLMLLAWLEETR